MFILYVPRTSVLYTDYSYCGSIIIRNYPLRFAIDFRLKLVYKNPQLRDVVHNAMTSTKLFQVNISTGFIIIISKHGLTLL